jgi:3-oxoacyl-[acyl-carrier protein] reductase
MDLGLKEKTIFITGASSGIGAEAVRLCAQEGADVIISYCCNQEGAQAVAEAVRSQGRRAWLLPMDIARPEAIHEAIQLLPAEIEALDGLVLCAGLSLHTDFDAITPDEWNRVLSVNLTGAFFTLQALTPLLREGSAVVAVASVSAQTGVAHQAHYAAAKAGLVNLTKSAARALAPRVRVNCVTPGITLTPMGQDTIEALDKDYARTKMLLQRYAAPEEIARVIVFLASPANSFMTGATVDVNGGRELR